MSRPGTSPKGGADLHVHTTHSDGLCSPGEVVRAAADRGLAALAITDHDTLSALAVARPEAARVGVELIHGIELTCVREGRELPLADIHELLLGGDVAQPTGDPQRYPVRGS